MKKYQLTLLTNLYLIYVVLGFSVLKAAELPPLTHQLLKLDKPHFAPGLKLSNMDDEVVDLAQLKGKVILINFWASWCPPCRREMSSLQTLYQKLKSRGVVVIAVNVGEDTDTIFPFLGTLPIMPEFPILLDQDARTLVPWQVRGLPTTYIINRQGKIVYHAIGGRQFDHPQIVSTLLRIL